MDLEKDKQVQLYRTMIRIRRFEERVIDLLRAGKVVGAVHSYIGEEAIATGVCAALEPGDYIVSTHRGHGHCIAKGLRMDRMMAELYGKTTGYNKGKGGSMHIADFSQGMLGANGIVGAGIAIAGGAAWSSKMRETDQVAVAFFGDGAANRGTFHEALNMAAIWNLPVVYVCEYNGWAVSCPSSYSCAAADMSVRGASYSMPGVSLDGNDVLAVYRAAREAVDRARRGEGPAFLVCHTMRQRGHSEGDPQIYRSDVDQKEANEKDPIPRYQEHLLASGIVSEEDLVAIEEDVRLEVEHAVRFAEASPDPRPEDALEDVYAAV
jgi:TPP-dependent pyruvate/acetoin dehydrogenase alpha subunit